MRDIRERFLVAAVVGVLLCALGYPAFTQPGGYPSRILAQAIALGGCSLGSNTGYACIRANTTTRPAIDITTPGGSGDAAIGLTTAGQQNWSIGIDRSLGSNLLLAPTNDLTLPTWQFESNGNARMVSAANNRLQIGAPSATGFPGVMLSSGGTERGYLLLDVSGNQCDASFTANGTCIYTQTGLPFAVSIAGTKAFQVTNATTLAGPAGVDFTPECSTISTATGTGWASMPTLSGSICRVGRMVTVTIASVATGTSNSGNTNFTNAIPTNFRPSSFTCAGTIGGTNNSSGVQDVAIAIETNGTIAFSLLNNNDCSSLGVNWTASGTKAISRGSFSYIK